MLPLDEGPLLGNALLDNALLFGNALLDNALLDNALLLVDPCVVVAGFGINLGSLCAFTWLGIMSSER